MGVLTDPYRKTPFECTFFPALQDVLLRQDNRLKTKQILERVRVEIEEKFGNPITMRPVNKTFENFVREYSLQPSKLFFFFRDIFILVFFSFSNSKANLRIGA